MEGHAFDSLQRLLRDGHQGTFDFILIDADKINLRNYYELALQLARRGALIAINNVLWGG